MMWPTLPLANLSPFCKRQSKIKIDIDTKVVGCFIAHKKLQTLHPFYYIQIYIYKAKQIYYIDQVLLKKMAFILEPNKKCQIFKCFLNE